MVSDAVGLSGHLPECVLFVSFPSRMKRSGETLKRESDVRPRSASVGDNGSVGEGRESRAGFGDDGRGPVKWISAHRIFWVKVEASRTY
jgi:hypothetical protein